MIKIMRIDEFASYGVNEMAVKGSALAQYDEVDRFNDEYLKVMKNGKYNLIDFDGNELSSIWFDDIEERKDHTFDVKFRDEANNVHTGNFDTNKTPVTETTFKVSLNIPELNPIFNEIGINDIVVLFDPYTISNNVTDEKVKIVAIVTFKGQQYQLGEDGNLYDYDNKPYLIVDGDFVNKLTPSQVGYEYEHKNKAVIDFVDKYENGFYAIGERVTNKVNGKLSSINSNASTINVYRVELSDGRYDNIANRVNAKMGAQHLSFDVVLDIIGKTNASEDDTYKFFSDNFPDDIKVERGRYDCYVEDGMRGEDDYIGKFIISVAVRYDWNIGENGGFMPLDAYTEKTLVKMLTEVVGKIYDHYNSDKDKVKLTNRLNDAFSYNSQMFPMFARFYNFGDGEKLYILFGTSLWKGKENDEEWTLTDDDIDILNKHCGCDVTDSEHINYDELDENGVKLENLEYYADGYIDDRPAISDAIAGIKMSEMDVKYRTESNCNFKSDDRTGGLDFLDKIVEYNDLYDYKHGYFMKCFEDIDEVLANSDRSTRSIVDTLKQIRSSDLLVRSIADLSNNKY